MANESGVRPGWYADPLGRFELRYYNGASWTADVATDDGRFVDPLGVTPDESDRSRPTVPQSGDAPTDRTNSIATAAMVLGIVAVTVAWVPFIVVVGVIAAVLAIVFGVVGRRRARATGIGGSRAVVGLVTGASALVVAVLGIVLTVIVLEAYDDYLDPASHETEVVSCDVAGSRATATVAITNLSDDDADFSVQVAFVRPGTDNPDRTTRVDVEDVGAGQRTEFEVARQVSLDDVDCLVVEVNGPLPFGIAID